MEGWVAMNGWIYLRIGLWVDGRVYIMNGIECTLNGSKT